MKKDTITFAALLIIVVLMGACGNNEWDEMPTPIQKFVNQYYPLSEVRSYATSTSGSSVDLKDSALLRFDSSYEWTLVDGRGQQLPNVLLYDQLPPALYNYLLTMEANEGVYSIERDGGKVSAQLLSMKVDYDEVSGDITESASSAPTI